MGPLRDVQVQLENLTHLPQSGMIVEYKKSLERREQRKIDNLPDDLKRGVKRQLSVGYKEVRSKFSRLYDSGGKKKIQRDVERVLTLRSNEFAKAKRRFRRLQPADEEALHEMRIALKKLRYTVEAAQPVLGASAQQRTRKMHAFQQLLGETRDIEILRNELKEWAAKKGKIIAIVPALTLLQEKREKLLSKIIQSAMEFGEISKAGTSRPVVERTHAQRVAGTVIAQESSSVGPGQTGNTSG